MHSSSILGFVSAFVASASATGVLLPLYVYPSAVYNDGAANWKPVFDAVSAHPSVPWSVVVDPHNGPGLSGLPGDNDANYISGVSQLNAYSNVKTIGYVRTNYATSSMDELKKNITQWHDWSTYTGADIAVDGIFFDESTDNFSYLNEAITFARTTFGSNPITTICNFGATAPAEYYSICDIVIAFESCLNCVGAPQYQSQTTISANIPSGYEPLAAVIVHDFTGAAYDGSIADASLLATYLNTLKSDNVGWAYFCSAGYDSITTGPATVGQVAQDLA
ncbi:putative cell surface spherulin 4-like protein [Phaeoacremonium minimum UCRPA7]|uniref:Putative cell surface spherulin 4-like protein n=1 Tax=Phaeoacremonium minimum (strain UCR-PA7) TaxID=1286976 RepID=R8BLZ7_PHAM7|nr:putative cell surface spherulin 4-like protein [Phaeoacremonium minimum UCRPA7]EOO00305.1 putative cell surface spherulin 4-like protein [Phaeoacremonium minimum UCRPA7]